MIDLTIMAKTNERETPGCSGCDYLIEHDWTCDYIGYTGRSRLKDGAKMYPGGGCRKHTGGGRNGTI